MEIKERPISIVPPSEANPQRERILIVDDEENIRRMLQRTLQGPSRCVETAKSGEEALSRLAASAFDLVVTDLNMPGTIDGQTLFRRIREMPQAPDVIIVSGLPTLESTLEAFRYGASDYLTKPINLNILRTSVRRCLRQHRNLDSDDPAILKEKLQTAYRKINAVENMRGVLSQYVGGEILDTILGAKTQNGLQGEHRTASILFTDIRGFTEFSQSRSPDVVVSVLNSLLERLTAAVTRCGGVVDKYTGDGLMAVFGAPRKRDDHADCAAKCALEMIQDAKAWNDERIQRGLPPLYVGIGINSGDVVAGSVGSVDRSDYTVIGAGVNLAARLESMAGANEILVGPATAAELSIDYDLQSRGLTQIKGLKKPVSVFRLAGPRD